MRDVDQEKAARPRPRRFSALTRAEKKYVIGDRMLNVLLGAFVVFTLYNFGHLLMLAPVTALVISGVVVFFVIAAYLRASGAPPKA